MTTRSSIAKLLWIIAFVSVIFGGTLGLLRHPVGMIGGLGLGFLGWVICVILAEVIDDTPIGRGDWI